MAKAKNCLKAKGKLNKAAFLQKKFQWCNFLMTISTVASILYLIAAVVVQVGTGIGYRFLFS